MKSINTGFYLLVVTALAALLKGVQYGQLGRLLPLFVAALPIVTVLLLVFQPGKQANFLGRTWAWLLIAWGVIRGVITLVAKLTNTITENHVHEQSGILGTCLSVLAIVIGIYLLRRGFGYLRNPTSATFSNT